MKLFKSITFLSILNLIQQSSAAEPIEVSCGQCLLLKNCQTGNCLKYNGGGLKGVEECSKQKKCSTVNYPYFYFAQTCDKDSDGTLCQYDCCLKLSTAATSPKTCTDTFVSPSSYCSAQVQGTNAGAIAGAVVGVLAGIFVIIVLSCFIYHQCYLKKKKMEEQAETEHAKSVRNSGRQKSEAPSVSKDSRKKTVKTLKSETDETFKGHTSTVEQSRKKKGTIKTKKSRAQILQKYGAPQSQAPMGQGEQKQKEQTS